jgi:glucuronoarabinoxylan endo-1,4-beta-xylanase
MNQVLIKKLTFLLTLSLTISTLNAQTTSPSTLQSEASIHFNKYRQKIDGFGASNAWLTYGLKVLPQALQDSLWEFLFDPVKGLGLSILRNRLPPNVFTEAGVFNLDWDIKYNQIQFNLLKSRYGLNKLFTSPWSPPAYMKDNNNEIQGKLKKESYRDYANYLANYVIEYKNRFGIDVYAISIQNEPDWKPTYESCEFTSEDFIDFLVNHMGPVWEEKGLTTKIIVGESLSFNEKLLVPILNNPLARKYVDIVGVHLYADPTAKPFPVSKSFGKTIWMTESSGKIDNFVDNSIDSALNFIKIVHDDLVITEVNAWLFWWMSNLVETSVHFVYINKEENRIVKKNNGYVFGHYSRFIRPDFERVDATANPANDVYLSAYRNIEKDNLIVVVINKGLTDVSQVINLTKATASTYSSWRTSATEQLTQVDTDVKVSSDKFTLVFKARSITTYVFKVTQGLVLLD